MPIPDHYATLGVTATAAAREIRAARRRQLKLHHPDVAKGDAEGAQARTIAILVAGQVLLDRSARAAYDGQLARSRPVSARVPPANLGAPGQDIRCATCHHSNLKTSRHYCIFCGAGIGPTPRPVTMAHASRRASNDSPIYDVATGMILGVIALAMPIAFTDLVSPTISGVRAFMLLAIPAAIGGIIAALFSERIRDWWSDIGW